MDHTYNKIAVIGAANACAQYWRAERTRKLAEWDAHSRWHKFFQSVLFSGDLRPKNYGRWNQKVAERISFRATTCIEANVYLSNDEIDTIREFWGLSEQG